MKWDAGTIISILSIILSIVVSYFFYRRSKKTKKMITDLETTVLVSSSLKRYDSLTILYNDERITSLNSTTIKIRNIGNDIIEPSDMIPTSPIIIKTSDKFLLQDTSEYKIECSNSKNRAWLEKQDSSTNQLKVLFDFLKPKEEISVAVLHTGNITVTGDLKEGDVKHYSDENIKTVSKGSNSSLEDSHYSRDGYSPIYSMAKFVVLLLFVILQLFFMAFFLLSDYGFNDRYKIMIELMMLFAMINVFAMYFNLNHK